MQSLHRVLCACFTWGSPGRRCRVLSAVCHHAAFAPVLVPALVHSPALQERWNSVNSELAWLYSRGAACGCAHLPCAPAPLLSRLSRCRSSTSRSGSGSCRCSRTGALSTPALPGRAGFVVQTPGNV